MSAPLYLEPIVGYRSWSVNPETYSLDARIIRTPWESETKTEASCHQESQFWLGQHDKHFDVPLDHVAPHKDCSCGLYALHTISDAVKDYGGGTKSIIGAAVFWGEIVVHTAGFKAQYGRVVALADHKKSGRIDYLGWSALLEQVVSRYSVPVLPFNLLGEYAKTFGTELGAEYFGTE